MSNDLLNGIDPITVSTAEQANRRTAGKSPVTACVEHVITGLGLGGAELMLSKLATGGRKFTHMVTSISRNGVVGEKLSAQGVKVTIVRVRKDPRGPADLLKLNRLLRVHQPIVVQTWLYHADFTGGVAAKCAGIPVVWNLRQTNVAPGVHKLNTALIIRLCALLSRIVPHSIVCGSNSALAVHGKMGFDVRKMVVIRNGVDTGAFKPDQRARRDVRSELKVPAGAAVIGRIGRFHAQKDYRGFIEAAARIARQQENTVFLLAGDLLSWDNQSLANWIRQHGLESKVRLLGQRIDVPRIMSACDLLVSSSIFGEGFPNVVAEGMACGVPCVATDVGDSAEIVDDPERVVAPGEPSALAEAALRVLRLPENRRLELGAGDRARIVRHFDVHDMIRSYEVLYEQFEDNRRVGINSA